MRISSSKVVGVFLIVCLAGCSGSRVESGTTGPPDRTIEVTLLQLNDVYEITPVEGGKRGGLARVATLREALLAENPNTITVLSGDFYSPSALGTARVDGERLAGKQMVAVLNAMGLDIATFGNHEFDVSRNQFYQRLQESEFTYVSSNVFDENGALFPGVQSSQILKIPGQPGDTLRLGMIGVTLNSNPKDYVSYAEPLAAARNQVDALKDQTEAIVALTHLALDQDIDLAEQVPEVDLILGSHEHQNIQVWRGPNLTPIAKADANARTVYVHKLRYDPPTGTVETESALQLITDAIPDHPATAAVVEHWLDIAFAGFEQSGLDPEDHVVELPEPLDGLDSSVRYRDTALCDLIADAMLRAAEGADLSVFNTGSVRIDDIIAPGLVTEYDVIRVLPFGGDILTVSMPGSLLDSTLTQGVANRGTGGFLQHANVTREGFVWQIGGQALDPARTYRVAINDFLVSGNEANLDYLTLEDPRVQEVTRHGDIRLAVIDELVRRYGTD